jgi:hypothetical protein
VKIVTWCPCLLLLLAPVPVEAQTASADPVDEVAAADLTRLIHRAIVAHMPGVYEDKSGWGHTIPLPERVILPRLKRTVVQVGDHMEVPDGSWRKVRLRLEDPDRDLHIHVRSFKRLGPMTYRVVVDADVAVRSEADLQQWRNGVALADLTARADVGLTVRVECDVTARLAAGKAPARLILEPEIKDLKLNLKEFTPKQVTFRRAGLTIGGGAVEAAGEEVRGAVQVMLRSMEPDVKQRAGEALARALKEGKDPLPAAEVLRAAAPLLKEK